MSSNTNMSAAREQARQIQAQQSRKRRNVTIVSAIVAVAIIAGLIALAIGLTRGSGSDSGASDGANASSNSSSAGTAAGDAGISVGSALEAGSENEGATRVDIYFDYGCSHCAHLEEEYGEKLQEAAKAGDITLVYHPVAVMGHPLSLPGSAIERFVAEHEPESYLAVHNAMHKELIEPAFNGELEAMPTNEELVAIATKAGLSAKAGESLEKALDDGSMQEKVQAANNAFFAAGYTGTPTVLMDGKKSDSWVTAMSELFN